MKLYFDIEGLRISDMALSNAEPLIWILDDEIMFNIEDFRGKILCDYSYLSDPPIFGDIGSFELDIKNNSFFLDTKSDTEDHIVKILIDEIWWMADGMNFTFDGISDMSSVVGDVLNFGSRVLTDRLVSLF